VLDVRAHRAGAALRGLVAAGQLDPTEPMVLRNVAAVLWNLAWFLRIALVVGVFVVVGTAADGTSGSARVAAGAVLAVVAGAAWWFGRDLPRAEPGGVAAGRPA